MKTKLTEIKFITAHIGARYLTISRLPLLLLISLLFRTAGPQNLILAQEPPLVLHMVAPEATDPAIDQALDDHLAWLDPTAHTNHKLFVFLPGRSSAVLSVAPTNYQFVQEEAARLGYHVIGLMYVNDVNLKEVCAGSPDLNSCLEDAHFEIVYGNGLGIDSPVVDVNQPNSIVNRLTRLLQYLDANYPDEGWSEFLADGHPNWSHIAVGGHSQGGGNAVMIAKHEVVDRVVMISAVVDTVSEWELTHVTPSARYWGLAHDRDDSFEAILTGWESLGMTGFGPVATVEASSPPYGFTHRLVTDLKPQRGGFKSPNPHLSTVFDLYTPLDHPGGTPTLAEAWQYMMSQ
ncbi:MAG TPA: hypothetical protein VKB46_23365 [Pyrinomonadaceae bacterium]|nr:hypothetical protein [Pyrinomonadaceae bacterium]